MDRDTAPQQGPELRPSPTSDRQESISGNMERVPSNMEGVSSNQEGVSSNVEGVPSNMNADERPSMLISRQGRPTELFPGKCTRCKRLKMQCVFDTGQDVCQRCQHANKNCSFEPSISELLLQLERQGQLIDSLLQQLQDSGVRPNMHLPSSIPVPQSANSQECPLDKDLVPNSFLPSEELKHGGYASATGLKEDQDMQAHHARKRRYNDDIPDFEPHGSENEPWLKEHADDISLGVQEQNQILPDANLVLRGEKKRRINPPISQTTLGHNTADASGLLSDDANQTLPPNTQSGGYAHATLPTIVHSLMTSTQIAEVLTNHGCLDLTEQLDQDSCSSFAVSNGGFGDVYSGRLKDGTRIAIKVFRLHLAHSDSQCGKHLKHVAKELYTWSKCQHPNVLRLLGLAEFRGQIGMISPWMENGSIRAYLRQWPNVDRRQLCYSVSSGLAYLHGVGIIHGDLKGANVLISDDGTPLLTDFGNSVLNDRSLQFTQTTTKSSVSLRWTAPEVLEGSVPSSYAGDVFSLGMTMLETITGNVPYYELERDQAVIMAIVCKKKIPVRPEGSFSPESERDGMLWSLLTRCWAYEPERRPAAREVRDVILRILNLEDLRTVQNAKLPDGLATTQDNRNQSPPGDQPNVDTRCGYLIDKHREGNPLAASTMREPSQTTVGQPHSISGRSGHAHLQSQSRPYLSRPNTRRPVKRHHQEVTEDGEDSDEEEAQPVVARKYGYIPSKLRLPGACNNCKRLKMKCVFEEGVDVCQGCKYTNKTCIVEGRKPRCGPNPREQLMLKLTRQNQLIDSLLRQIENRNSTMPLPVNTHCRACELEHRPDAKVVRDEMLRIVNLEDPQSIQGVTHPDTLTIPQGNPNHYTLDHQPNTNARHDVRELFSDGHSCASTTGKSLVLGPSGGDILLGDHATGRPSNDILPSKPSIIQGETTITDAGDAELDYDDDSPDMLAAMYAMQNPAWWDSSSLPVFDATFVDDDSKSSKELHSGCTAREISPVEVGSGDSTAGLGMKHNVPNLPATGRNSTQGKNLNQKELEMDHLILMMAGYGYI